MEEKDINSHLRDWRRYIQDLVDESQQLDDPEESDVRELLDELEREGERIFKKIKKIVSD